MDENLTKKEGATSGPEVKSETSPTRVRPSGVPKSGNEATAKSNSEQVDPSTAKKVEIPAGHRRPPMPVSNVAENTQKL